MIKRYSYKVYRNGTYLGQLTDVRSLFEWSHEINSAGAMITIEVAKSVDTASMIPDLLACEDDTTLGAEDGTDLALERVMDIIGDSSDQILMREGNTVKVTEFNDYSPNGKQMFSGRIEHVEATFGENADDLVTLYVYSDGYDLNSHVIPGTASLFLDQSQAAQDDYIEIWETSGSGASLRYAQTIRVAHSNIAAITLKLQCNSGGTFKISLMSSISDFYNGVSPLGTATQFVSSSSLTDVTFTFPSPITTTVNGFYTIVVQALVSNTANANIGFHDSISYPSGTFYLNLTSYSDGKQWLVQSGTEMYFKTYYSTLTTKSAFSLQDPSNMLLSFMASYTSEGGAINANSGTVDLTGIAVPYTFNLATTLEGIQVVKSLAPSNYYWYVDLQTDLLYFKPASTTADFILIRGRHINSIKLVSTIENVKNKIFFTGGDTGAGQNYYSAYSDYTSITNYGISVDRISDNRITTATQADAVGKSYLAENKDKQYQTKVTVLAGSMDITLLKPGKTVTFRGFGTFVDSLIIQIVRVDYTPDRATLTLGALPPRLNNAFVQIKSDLNALQTVDNPATPS